MSAHLGNRVSALLDGQLPEGEADRAWEHVHSCHVCRDAVEREGWVKTRLAGLSWGSESVPEHLKGSLLGASSGGAMAMSFDDHERRIGLIALGGSAVGAAVLAVLAVGVGPADSPSIDRTPLTNFVGPTQPVRNAPEPVVESVRPSR